MIGIGDDVIISGKVVEVAVTEICIRLNSGKETWIPISDIKSYHPYQPIPETDERKGN